MYLAFEVSTVVVVAAAVLDGPVVAGAVSAGVVVVVAVWAETGMADAHRHIAAAVSNHLDRITTPSMHTNLR